MRAAFCEDRLPADALVEEPEGSDAAAGLDNIPPDMTTCETSIRVPRDTSESRKELAPSQSCVGIVDPLHSASSITVASGVCSTTAHALVSAPKCIPTNISAASIAVASPFPRLPDGVDEWMYEHGLTLLAALSPGSKVTRNQFATQLNLAVNGSSCEISSESARRLLNFLASAEGDFLVHHVARGTTYSLHTDNIKRRFAMFINQSAAVVASVASLAAVAGTEKITDHHESGAAMSLVPNSATCASTVSSASVSRPNLGDPALQPYRAIVAIMTQFGGVSTELDDPKAPDSVGGYVTVPALTSALGVDTDVSRDLMAALEADGFVAAVGFGGVGKHKGRAVLVTPRTRRLLRKAQTKLVAAGFSVQTSHMPGTRAADLTASATASTDELPAGSKRQRTSLAAVSLNLRPGESILEAGSESLEPSVVKKRHSRDISNAPAVAPRSVRTRRSPLAQISSVGASCKGVSKETGVELGSAGWSDVDVSSSSVPRGPFEGKSTTARSTWGSVPSLWAAEAQAVPPR